MSDMTSQEVFDTLKKRAAGRGKVVLRNCSMCGYPCGYLWASSGQLLYDSGCDCTTTPYVTGQRDDSDLIDILEMNKDTGLAERMLAQWPEVPHA